MTSQLCQNFEASQEFYGADDIKTTHFRARSILLAFVVPKLKLSYLQEKAGVPNLIQLTLVLVLVTEQRFSLLVVKMSQVEQLKVRSLP